MLWGRESEVAALVDPVRAGTPAVLVGPAGVGKSTLARAVLSDLGSFGQSGALATLRWSPMLVFRRLLKRTLPVDPADVAAQIMSDQPQGGGLLLDDLQWADDLTFAVISVLATRLPILATVRSTDPEAARALELLGSAGFDPVDVDPLTPIASGELLDATAPALSSDRRAEVLMLAAGNPLLLIELADSRHDSPTLLQVLLDRLAAMPSEAQTAMERLSVLGRPASARLLGSGSDDLVESGLGFVSDGLIWVRHDVLAEVVIEDLGPRANAVRRELANDVEPAEGAFLLAAAGERSQSRALALVAASTASEESVSKADRAELMCLAVAQASEGDLDAHNRVAAARALSWSGRPERALTMASPAGIERLSPLVRGTLRAAAAEAAWACSRDRFPELVDLALADLSGTGTVAEVEILAASTIVDTRINYDGRPAIDRARAAVALADELGVKRGFARCRLGSVLLTSGKSEWVRHYREAVRIARDEGDHRSVVIATESLVLGQWPARSTMRQQPPKRSISLDHCRTTVTAGWRTPRTLPSSPWWRGVTGSS